MLKVIFKNFDYFSSVLYLFFNGDEAIIMVSAKLLK